MFNHKIKGARCVVLKRCSSPPQVETSIANQGRTVEFCAAANDLKIVWEKPLEGVSGSIPGNRQDIDEIIARKRRLNDFTLLVIQDVTRFTRAGLGHGQKLLYELRAAGITVYFVAEDLLVDNTMAEMYVSFLLTAANQTAKSISYGVVNGSANGFLQDRSPHCRIPPLGLDRMYSLDGKDLHIIRNRPDGTQLMLHPTTGDVIRQFEPNQSRGVPCHYIKQKGERIRLIPGDLQAVALVHLIFQRHYGNGLSCHAIARDLNDAGIASVQGSEWYVTTIRKLLINPIYVGLAIRCRVKRGIYYMGSANGAMPSGVTMEELANHPNVKTRRRPRTEWMEKSQPHLSEFLPEGIRELARAKILRHLDEIADGNAKNPNRDRHLSSSYFLKKLLRSKQGNELMTGTTKGKKNRPVRYYNVSRAGQTPRTKNVLLKLVPADPLEKAVVGVLKAVLLNRPQMDRSLKELVDKNQQSRSKQTDVEKLAIEMKQKKRQLVLLTDQISGIADQDDPIERKMHAIKQSIRQIDAQLRAAEAPTAKMQIGHDKVMDHLAERLQRFGRNIERLNTPPIRRMLELLLTKLEVDLVTKEVEIELALPSWMPDVLFRNPKVGLDELIRCRPIIETHPQNSVILGKFKCNQDGKSKCIDCQRLAA
ncbi:MAG TPA: recombinase family protein [Tepidisphaeraceae bacterium]|jgi:hypothetical protein|nr:recombinase family protein [Tepidisphaeraceae bacterium]